MKTFTSIAIDGPAASGKSSVGLKLAEKLGFSFLDTGVMYRAVTWACLQKNVNLKDPGKVTEVAQSINIKINPPTMKDGRVNDIIVNGKDITWDIRGKDVNDFVSIVSTYFGVRDEMTNQQRQFAKRGNIVMAGRDIGTVVLPDADYKFFLNASIKERARRRFDEEIMRGEISDYERIFENLRLRDSTDSGREIAPLVPAEDSIIINSDNKKICEVVEEIMQYIRPSG